MAQLRSIIALGLAALCCGPAQAQSLQRLTVTQLTLSSDVASPHVEVPFNLIVTARVRERVTELRNLDLPILAEVELLGDEHTVVSSTDGTTYTERVRVVAHHSGVITIAPVTLDAIDARDGKAKRFSSNSLVLSVGGASPVSGFAWTQGAVDTLRMVLTWVIAVAALVLIIVLLFRRRRKQLPEPTLQPDPQPVPAPRLVLTREQRLRDARTVLEAERSRGAVVRVRTMVREMVGADDAETLADVLRRIEPDERPMRGLLFALERAAFTHDDNLNHAVDQVIVCLNEIIA